jgi:hypothetical protein
MTSSRSGTQPVILSDLADSEGLAGCLWLLLYLGDNLDHLTFADNRCILPNLTDTLGLAPNLKQRFSKLCRQCYSKLSFKSFSLITNRHKRSRLRRKGEQTDFSDRNQLEIKRNHGKSREITEINRNQGNHQKSPEITRNHQKSPEITRNHQKSTYIILIIYISIS